MSTTKAVKKESQPEHSKVENFLINHGKTALISIVVLIVIITSICYAIFKQKASSEQDYLAAQRYYQKFVAASASDENQYLSDLQKIIDKHPELAPKYNALIAQNLLIYQQPQEAQKYLNENKAYISEEEQTPYHSYAETSILMSENNNQEALTKAMQINDQLANNPNPQYYNSLFAFNLLRIALLNQVLDNKDAELQTWSTIKQYLSSEKETAFQQMKAVFSKNNVSLDDYIAQREKILQK